MAAPLRTKISVLSKTLAKSRFVQIRRKIASQPGTRYAPLEGIRILDISRILAGPHCTMTLGDLGAEIIKVERPGTGDDTRTWFPPKAGTESVYFLSINRNKKSLAVNIKKPEGATIVKELAKKCDVLIENYLPGKLPEMGLGYEDLHKINPRLIYLSLTGFGQTGPFAKQAGYDVIAAAVGGLMHITGPQDGEPCRVGVAMTDLTTGLYAHGAIMAALIHRNKTNKGQHIDCNLLNCQVAILSHIACNYLMAGMEAKRWGTGHGTVVPYQAFKTKDEQYIIIGAGNNNLFKDLCEKMNITQLIDDERYKDNECRVVNRSSLINSLQDRFSQLTLAEWLDVFEGSSCPYGPINNMQQVFSHPQVLHNNMIQEIDHPTAGKVRAPGPPVKHSEGDLIPQCPPPTLGQHTTDVMQDMLGYSEQNIEDLRQRGVIE